MTLKEFRTWIETFPLDVHGEKEVCAYSREAERDLPIGGAAISDTGFVLQTQFVPSQGEKVTLF